MSLAGIIDRERILTGDRDIHNRIDQFDLRDQLHGLDCAVQDGPRDPAMDDLRCVPGFQHFDRGNSHVRESFYSTYQQVFLWAEIFTFICNPGILTVAQVCYLQLAWFVIMVTVAAAAPKHNDSEFVFRTWMNNTGWENNVICFITGLANPLYSLGGLDGITVCPFPEDV